MRVDRHGEDLDKIAYRGNPNPKPNWIGQCVTDEDSSQGKGRLLPKRVSVSNLTPAKCRDACLREGYSFAGVQYAAYCFCGNVGPPPNKIVAMGECNMGCRGDASIKCGGSWRMNVYNSKGTSNVNQKLIVKC